MASAKPNLLTSREVKNSGSPSSQNVLSPVVLLVLLDLFEIEVGEGIVHTRCVAREIVRPESAFDRVPNVGAARDGADVPRLRATW